MARIEAVTVRMAADAAVFAVFDGAARRRPLLVGGDAFALQNVDQQIGGHQPFAGCESPTEVVIPEGVLIIGPKAFKRCTNLTEVEIPASVVSIGDEAFAECPCEAELKKKYPHLFP